MIRLEVLLPSAKAPQMAPAHLIPYAVVTYRASRDTFSITVSTKTPSVQGLVIETFDVLVGCFETD